MRNRLQCFHIARVERNGVAIRVEGLRNSLDGIFDTPPKYMILRFVVALCNRFLDRHAGFGETALAQQFLGAHRIARRCGVRTAASRHQKARHEGSDKRQASARFCAAATQLLLPFRVNVIVRDHRHPYTVATSSVD
ncbi:MAG: hypothetical protein KAF42_12240 [Sphingopyxis terrae]|nr:hypothetical protein [Sphingopyxis terrae]